MSKFSIPLCKVNIDDNEINAAVDVIKSGWMTHGPKNKEFEALFADYIGVKHAITMNSCTSALFMALIANGITGEVILPSFTFAASANAIVTAGGTPVFADIDYDTCNIDTTKIEALITEKTEAVMAVHYAGQCCDMDALTAICEKHGLLLIEDSAENIGGSYDGKMGGSFGVGCYSFFPTKNITTGEGGMLTTNDDEIAEKVRTLIGHGISKTTVDRVSTNKSWYREAVLAGYNFRMSNILAAIGVEQMAKIEAMNGKRIEASEYLNSLLSGVQGLHTPVRSEKCVHTYQMYTIKVDSRRNELVGFLKDNGIEASVHFDPPVHLHEAHKEYVKTELPVTELVADTILTLPMFPGITKDELDTIAECIKKFYK